MIPTNGKARPGDVVAALEATKECAMVASSTTLRRMRRLLELRAIVLAGALVLAACGPASPPPEPLTGRRRVARVPG